MPLTYKLIPAPKTQTYELRQNNSVPPNIDRTLQTLNFADMNYGHAISTQRPKWTLKF